jgi:pimeloyl-ACP methyl ester carboxylesterase
MGVAPVVFLHGLGGTADAWRPVLDLLPADVHGVALTLPGHGSGPVLSDPATLAQLVQAVEMALDGRGIRQAHFVGNSLGGLIALEIARHGRALSVVALAPIGCLAPEEIGPLVRRLRISRRAATAIRPVARLLAKAAWGRRLLFAEAIHEPARLTPDEAHAALLAYANCPGFERILQDLSAHPPAALPSGLECPVCVAWPENDRLTPLRPYAARFEAALPSATHVTIPAAGHMPMSDAPGVIVDLIQRAVRSAAAR